MPPPKDSPGSPTAKKESLLKQNREPLIKIAWAPYTYIWAILLIVQVVCIPSARICNFRLTMETAGGDINTNIGELAASDSDSADGVDARRRPLWAQIWRSTAVDSLRTFETHFPHTAYIKPTPLPANRPLFDKNYT